MDPQSPDSVEQSLSFGPFRLLPAQQLLLEGGNAVRLGSRALELLIVLAQRAGELVTKGELMTRVWPNTVVEENNLKVHIATLRRTLGDGQPGRRYVATVPGRGYRFVAPVEVSPSAKPRLDRSVKTDRAHNLPASQPRPIGRADTINALLSELPRRRFITIVGPGGIGKTTVALGLAEALITTYEHGIRFVDLAPLGDPHFVTSAVTSALGIEIHSDNIMRDLIAHLQDKRMLLMLDSCEHVIEMAATLAAQVLDGASEVHILATSREPLRAKGERVHRLSPLAVPSRSSRLTASQALGFSAVQLFVERAAANLDGFELSDADAPVVSDICRKLEGMPLAIEFAATRIDAFGVRQLCELLDDRIRLLRYRKRAALPRHQTLRAALDWSYEFLPSDERDLLRRLSVFAGAFSLDSARAISADANCDVVEGVANLVAKSLVSADVGGAVVQYRLLDTTRAYARQKLTESSELETHLRRHAEHHRELFERAEAEWETRPTAEWIEDYRRIVDDVRAALKWAFSPGGDISIGVALTVASIPLWLNLWLLEECREYVERALAKLLAQPRPNGRQEMKLLAALGHIQLHWEGRRPETDIAWTKVLLLAEKQDDMQYQLRAIWGLFVSCVNVDDYRGALARADQFRAVADAKGDVAAGLIGARLTGMALYFLADHGNARRHLERARDSYVASLHQRSMASFWPAHLVAVQTNLANILWIQGFPDQAVRAAQSALEEAQAADHLPSLFYVLIRAACPIALYVGNLTEAEHLTTMLIEHSAKYPLTMWDAFGRCVRGTLLMARGDIAGLAFLRATHEQLRESKLRSWTAALLPMLVQAMAGVGQTADARMVIDDALDQCARSGGQWCLPELLRIKGGILYLEGSGESLAAAEHHFMRALECARQQEALSWELRVVTSLAELWHSLGKTADAHQLLLSVYDRFTEGFETADLKTARALMTSLSRQKPS
jgi:predicted ATPase/DNA-binding winged helix-turn-helix (wHTH) protein